VDQPNFTAFPSLLNAEDRLGPVLARYFNAQRLDSVVEPAGEKSAALRPAKPTSFRAKIRPCILVVDDDSFNFDLLESAFERDYEVLFASDGISALEMAGERALELILLDVMMPDIDGYEVCRQLKARVWTAHVPVIFITGLRDRSSVTTALGLGAAGFVTKPIDARSVRSRVDNQIQIKRRLERIAKALAPKER
jgi:PleD family two-component response regulator